VPIIRTRQEPWRDVDVSESEASNLGRMGLLLPAEEYPDAHPAAVEPTATAPTRAPRGANKPSEG
jgi:hypothetical protein